MMISQDCQCNETNHDFSNFLQRTWTGIKRVVNRYRQWENMKHNHRLLLTMDNRLLKDIGLSRADAVRISNAHSFWKFMCQPETDGMKNQDRNN